MQTDYISPLIDQYGGELYRYCCHLARVLPDAEDLYQQTFLQLLESKIRVDTANNPRALLYSFATGIWKNEVRKRGRRAAIARPIELDGEHPPSLPAADSTEESAAQAALYRTLRDAIAALPLKYQTVVLLTYQAELSISEVAACEKLAPGTVKSRLHKARKLLKKEMEAQGYEAEL